MEISFGQPGLSEGESCLSHSFSVHKKTTHSVHKSEAWLVTGIIYFMHFGALLYSRTGVAVSRCAVTRAMSLR